MDCLQALGEFPPILIVNSFTMGSPNRGTPYLKSPLEGIWGDVSLPYTLQD